MLNKDLVTTAVASRAASVSDASLPEYGRAWVVLERTTQAPVCASAQGTRLPLFGSQLEPAAVGVARRTRGEITHYLPMSTTIASTVATTTKQLAMTGADCGVIPGRAWSPPD